MVDKFPALLETFENWVCGNVDEKFNYDNQLDLSIGNLWYFRSAKLVSVKQKYHFMQINHITC